MKFAHLMVLVPLIAGTSYAVAQDRLPPIATEKLSDAQKKAIEEFKAARGNDISGPFVPLLRSPK